MKLVITCAGRKRQPHISFLHEGRRVEFVAQPELAPHDSAEGVVYFRPDGSAPGRNATWRAVVEEYNLHGQNEQRFWEAFKLYEPRRPYTDIYVRLKDFADQEGHELFILSAGWGMVRSNYWLPHYEITFTRPQKAEKRYAFRSSKDPYQDFQHLTNAETTPIVVFTGQNYLDPLFYPLMRRVGGRKLVFHFENSDYDQRSHARGAGIPGVQGYEYLPYVPPDHIRKATRIWHYQCATDFIEHPRVPEWALTPEEERTMGPNIEQLWKDLRSNHR